MKFVPVIFEPMKVGDLVRYLDRVAPPQHAESYDNVGLLVGDPQREVDSCLVSLDCTEEVVEEAVSKGCGIIVCHHPIIFGGLKKLTGSDYVQRTVIKAIRNDVAIYAIHTNLDNQIDGVNAEIAARLGLRDVQILRQKKDNLLKVVVYCPMDHLEGVRNAMFEAGAGQIGKYSECSFALEGAGTFKANEGTNPFVGEEGERHVESEARLEVLVPSELLGGVLSAMIQAHPYEEVAYDIFSIRNADPRIGSGAVGLIDPIPEEEFLARLKDTFGCGTVRHTPLRGKMVEKVAMCGGVGSFLIGDAKACGADFFVTGDVKYHEFFDADGQLVVADIGHYESEQYTKDLLARRLMEKFRTFAIHLSEVVTNPVNYY